MKFDFHNGMLLFYAYRIVITVICKFFSFTSKASFSLFGLFFSL